MDSAGNVASARLTTVGIFRGEIPEAALTHVAPTAFYVRLAMATTRDEIVGLIGYRIAYSAVHRSVGIAIASWRK